MPLQHPGVNLLLYEQQSNGRLRQTSKIFIPYNLQWKVNLGVLTQVFMVTEARSNIFITIVDILLNHKEWPLSKSSEIFNTTYRP